MKDCDLSPLVVPYELSHPIDWDVCFGLSYKDTPLVVEIGFGMGEVLIREARKSPEKRFIGIEQIWERTYKTLRAMTLSAGGFSNVRILHMDARIIFERLFASCSIDHIYCLFPCPWPKKKHVKHRLFSSSFLRLLNNRLRSSGSLRIVTDDRPYVDWILEQTRQTGFFVHVNEIQPGFDTKFERKWRSQGQDIFFEIFLAKEAHQDVLVKEGMSLKGYKVDVFNPCRFSFTNVTGKITIIARQFLFDAQKQSGELLLLVSEQQMRQYFRVAIFKKDNGWRICKAEGQHFFATPGIVLALETVYQQIVKQSISS